MRIAQRPQQGVGGLRPGHRLDPKLAMAYESRFALNDMGDPKGAIADYTQVIAFDPTNAFAYNGRCWARAILGRELQPALTDCDESLRLRPSSATTFDSRGFVYLRLARFDQLHCRFRCGVDTRSETGEFVLWPRPSEARQRRRRGRLRRHRGGERAGSQYRR